MRFRARVSRPGSKATASRDHGRSTAGRTTARESRHSPPTCVFSRAAVAEADENRWRFTVSGVFEPRVTATDAATGAVVGEFQARTLRRGGALRWAELEFVLRPASAWRERYALAEGRQRAGALRRRGLGSAPSEGHGGRRRCTRPGASALHCLRRPPARRGRGKQRSRDDVVCRGRGRLTPEASRAQRRMSPSNDVGFVPFSPLGKGFLTGKIDETTEFERFRPDCRVAAVSVASIQPTSRAGHRRLRAEPLRDWARR